MVSKNPKGLNNKKSQKFLNSIMNQSGQFERENEVPYYHPISKRGLSPL